MKNAQRALVKSVFSNELLMAILLALMIIIIGVGLGAENNKIVPVNQAKSAHYNLEPRNHLSFLSDWDGPIYLSIAQHGYTSKIQANFFPLYPLAVRLVHTVVHSLVDSGLIVSWICLAGATYFYLKIIKQLYGLKDNLEAMRGVLFFLLFPTGVFLIATYTESLFAFMALGAIYCALHKKYIPAALFAMLATSTHVTGLFIVLFISLLLWERRVKPLKIAGSAIIGCLGLVAYMIYQKIKFNNALEFLAAQKRHNWLDLNISHLVTVLTSFNGLFILLLLITAAYWWHRRKSFSVYSLLFACIVFIAGKDLGGLGRYSLMAFPLQFMLYDYFRDKKVGYTLVIALSAILWTFFTLRYAGGYTGG
jgi:Gpi18-like mannosyltransferase